MKFLAPLFLLLSLTPLTAQLSLDNGGTPAQPAPSLTPAVAPAPARGIMPTGLNHKPNPVQPPAEIAASIDKFFKGLKGGDYTTTYNTFLAGTRLGAQTQKKSFFISKTQEAFGIYGGLNDYEIYDNYSVGSNIMVLTYLSRHEIQPLRWRFIYYRPEKSWGLINLGFDDGLMDMLD